MKNRGKSKSLALRLIADTSLNCAFKVYCRVVRAWRGAGIAWPANRCDCVDLDAAVCSIHGVASSVEPPTLGAYICENT